MTPPGIRLPAVVCREFRKPIPGIGPCRRRPPGPVVFLLRLRAHRFGADALLDNHLPMLDPVAIWTWDYHAMDPEGQLRRTPRRLRDLLSAGRWARARGRTAGSESEKLGPGGNLFASGGNQYCNRACPSPCPHCYLTLSQRPV